MGIVEHLTIKHLQAMTKKYKLLKELPGVPYGAIYTQENHDPNFFNTDGKSYYDRVSHYLIENNPEWFEEVKEQERIEVLIKGTGMAGEFVAVHPMNRSCAIPKEKFPAIKQAIEDVLNQENEWNEALRNSIKVKAEAWSSDLKVERPTRDFIIKGNDLDEYDGPRLYTQQQLDKAIEDAFEASRWAIGEYAVCQRDHFIEWASFKNFSDYKATLTNQK